jgi:hypothetical protein
MDLMLDIETLGSRANTVVLSVGAAVFYLQEPYSEATLEESIPPDDRFYAVLDLKPQAGRSVDLDAVKFWFQQSDAARLAQLKDPIHPVTALAEYEKFCKKHKVERGWANGATFDHVIMEDLHKHFQKRNPIHFKNQICMRTIRRLCQAYDTFPDMESIEGLVEHNALDDCLRQIVWLSKALRHLPHPLLPETSTTTS